jgi:putative flippase GtrA
VTTTSPADARRRRGEAGLLGRLRSAVDLVYREAIKFGAVGAVAFVTDVGLFNLLCTPLWPGNDPAPLTGHQKLAKVVSASVATLVAWLGNRYWTFRHRRQAAPHRELAQFAFMNVVGMLIAVGCLAVSHDLLHLTSTLADNLSGNVVGIGLGTLFRFWAYRRFVFTAGSLLPASAGPDRSPLGDESGDALDPVGAERGGAPGGVLDIEAGGEVQIPAGADRPLGVAHPDR